VFIWGRKLPLRGAASRQICRVQHVGVSTPIWGRLAGGLFRSNIIIFPLDVINTKTSIFGCNGIEFG
jgi:hypothetical protein